MIWFGTKQSLPCSGLALSSRWCHSYFAGRSQLGVLQLLRHPLRGKVSLGEPKLMKSYSQENISKTDGPIRQKNRTRIEERSARKKNGRVEIAETFKLCGLFYYTSCNLSPYSYFQPVLFCSFLLPFYPFYFFGYYILFLFFFSFFFTPSSFSVLTSTTQCCFHLICDSTETAAALEQK